MMRNKFVKLLTVLCLAVTMVACLATSVVAFADVDGYVHICDNEVAITDDDGNILGAEYHVPTYYQGSNTPPERDLPFELLSARKSQRKKCGTVKGKSKKFFV